MSTPLENALIEFRSAYQQRERNNSEFESLRQALEVAREKMYDSDRAFSVAEHNLHTEAKKDPEESTSAVNSVTPPDYNLDR